MTESYSEIIAGYIDDLRKDKTLMGVCNPLEDLDAQALPVLQKFAVSEQDKDIRAYLVDVVWQYRRPESIPFLAQMLSDSSREVWKRALDGLVALGTDDALAALKTARTRASSNEREYIDEAIDQLENPEAWPGIK
jgi:HEAT repeat protein